MMFCYLKINCEVWLVIFGALVAVLLRACTGLHPYSGENTPPMFGDYEAQRHWMEITTNLNIKEWYKNSTENNLDYWGLDYPPLTAYHMYILGKIAHVLNENYTKLWESHGYESPQHKNFMRLTVLSGDIFIFIPALIYYFYSSWQRNCKMISVSLSIIHGLLYPGIILIDHGHFQYNCISLGFLIIATTFIRKKLNILASIFFCLALNYKQMELYHSLPFFLYLLSNCIPKPGQTSCNGLVKLFKIGITVVLSFLLIWAPFCDNFQTFLTVFERQFPFNRGIFEDKVSNCWCFLNIFYKFNQNFSVYQMARMCLFVTLSAIFPASIDLFLRPNSNKFVLSLINTSLAFYLFSYQVHEKSILLVAIPVILYFPHRPFISFWFLSLSIFSMMPLLYKDNLILATIALTTFYVTSFRVSIEHFYRSSLNVSDGLAEYYRSLLHVLLDIEYNKATQFDIIKLTYNQIVKNKDALKNVVFHLCMLGSLFGCCLLSFVLIVFEPPTRYPDLFPLIISVYSALHFFAFFVYFNVEQIKIPQEFDYVKIKSC